jgi:hypothetical protein
MSKRTGQRHIMQALTRSIFCCVIFAASGPSCTPKEETKVNRSQTSAKTEPVPSDFVLNPFLPDDSNSKVAMQVRSDGGFEAGVSASTGTAGAQPSATAPESVADDIKVREAGAEPRSERRYTFAVGKSETRSALVKMSVAQGATAQEQPPIRFTFAITPQTKTATGARVEVKLTKVELVPSNDAEKALAAQASAQFAGVVGLSGVVEVSNRGKQGELAFNMPETKEAKKAARAAQELLPLVQQTVEVLYPPLPPGAIGVGAQWESTSKQSEQGMTVSVASAFTLKSWAGDSGVIVTNITRSAPKQAVEDPRMPPGATMAVDGKGSYEWSFRLDKPALKLVGDSETKITITAGGKTVVQAVKVHQTLEIP